MWQVVSRLLFVLHDGDAMSSLCHPAVVERAHPKHEPLRVKYCTSSQSNFVRLCVLVGRDITEFIPGVTLVRAPIAFVSERHPPQSVRFRQVPLVCRIHIQRLCKRRCAGVCYTHRVKCGSSVCTARVCQFSLRMPRATLRDPRL